MSHTTGTWEVKERAGDGLKSIMVFGGGGVAWVADTTPENASIIAAARDMEKALDGLGAIEGGGHCFCYETWRDPRRKNHSGRCRQGRAALAKARSEA